MKQIMRWAGPRMLWRHPVLTVRHLIDDRRPVPELPEKYRPKSEPFSVLAAGKLPAGPGRCTTGRGPAAAGVYCLSRRHQRAIQQTAKQQISRQYRNPSGGGESTIMRPNVDSSANRGMRSFAEGTSSICPSVSNVTNKTDGSNRNQPSGGSVAANIATLAKAVESSKSPPAGSSPRPRGGQSVPAAAVR